MSISQQALQQYLAEYLAIDGVADYCPNGLQVAGAQQINKIVTGVTASQALIDAAVEANADAVLVHHGYFWKGEAPEIVGMKYHRLKTLLAHDINLFAYHLPLDLHNKVGNNVQLAKQLGWEVAGNFDTGTPQPLGFWGQLATPLGLEALSAHLESTLSQSVLSIAGHDRAIERVAWCTGAAQDFIEHAAAQGFDAFISGEVSERTFHQAKELGIDYIAAGHHATERYGIKALGAHLEKQFPTLEVSFIEIANPV